MREMQIEDHTAQVGLTLWRELAEKEISSGQTISVTHVTRHTYEDEVTLATTKHSTITVRYFKHLLSIQ